MWRHSSDTITMSSAIINCANETELFVLRVARMDPVGGIDEVGGVGGPRQVVRRHSQDTGSVHRWAAVDDARKAGFPEGCAGGRIELSDRAVVGSSGDRRLRAGLEQVLPVPDCRGQVVMFAYAVFPHRALRELADLPCAVLAILVHRSDHGLPL